MMQVSILVCVFGLVGLSVGQVVELGQCNSTIGVVADFDVDKYVGEWYQIAAYPAAFQLGTCTNATYTLNNDTGLVDVYNTQVLAGTVSSINGTAKVASDDGSGKLKVTLTVVEALKLNVTSNYWVLATDYDSYALVYSCIDLTKFVRIVFSWKLSRTATLTDAAVTAIDAVVSSTDDLNEKYYVVTNRTTAACTWS